MGLERLFDLLVEFIDLFRCWFIIDQYERGIVLQLGKFRREVGPGFHLMLPFRMDQVLVDNVVTRTANLRTQTLTTQGGKDVVLSPVLSYRIRDLKKFMLEVEGAEHALADVTYGTIADMVRHSTFEDMLTDEWHDALYKEVRKQGFCFGIEVLAVRLSDLGQLRSFRLINSTDVVEYKE